MKIPTQPPTGEFHFRPGVPPIADGRWKGVNTEDDPSSLAPNELQRGENIRLRGKTIGMRPGLIEIADLGAASGWEQTPLYLKETPVDSTCNRLWYTTFGCVGGVIETGYSVFKIDTTRFPKVQVYSNYFATSDRQAPLATYGGQIYIGDSSSLRTLLQIASLSGVAAVITNTAPPQIPLITFPGFTIRCLLEFDGKLFIGLENNTTPAASKIVAWNGESASDDITAINPPLAFGIWRDRLVAGFGSTSAHVRYRVAGTSPGSWTTVAIAGSQCSTYGNAMVEVGPYLYIASGIDKIFRFDGAALTLVRTVTGAYAGVNGYGVTALALHHGLLYYGWNADTTIASAIGRHDPQSTTAGTEWIDTYKDITTEEADFSYLASLLSYRDQIYAGGHNGWVVATASNDVKGALELVASGSATPGPNFIVQQLVRF